jgi:hypothetical protein
MAKGRNILMGTLHFDLAVTGIDDTQKDVIGALKNIEKVSEETKDKIADAWGSGLEKIGFAFDVIKGAIEGIQATVAAFADRMGSIVDSSRETGAGLDRTAKALKLAEITGISLEDALAQIGESSAEAEEAQRENVQAMIEWRTLTSDLYDMLVDIGGALLKSIAPSFAKIVEHAQYWADILVKYVFPAIKRIVEGLVLAVEIGETLGASISGGISDETPGIVGMFADWFGEFEKLGTAAIKNVLNYFTDMWAAAASLLAGTSGGDMMLSKDLLDKRNELLYQEIARRERRGERVGDADRQQISRDMTRQVIEQEAIGLSTSRSALSDKIAADLDKESADREAGRQPKPWDERVKAYMDAALAPGKVEGMEEATAPSRSSVFGSFSSFGVAQRAGAGGDAQQQSLALLTSINGGINQLVRTSSGSLVATSSGNPTRAEIGGM